MADAVVVVASLSLELSLKGVAQEVASLLVFFRWVGVDLGAAQASGESTRGSGAAIRDVGRKPWHGRACRCCMAGRG